MKVRVYNIGGIVSPLEVELTKGVNIYKAPNAYGKTSLAKALVSLLTSAIKPDDLLNVFANSGYVELDLDGRTYYRRIKRVKNKIMESSKLLLDDDRALLLSYFSPENKLLNQIMSGEENVEWFISATSKINELKSKKEEMETKLHNLQAEIDDLNRKHKEAIELQTKIKQIEDEIARLEKEKESDKVLNKTTQTISITNENKLRDIREKIEVKKRELEDLQNRIARLDQEIKNKESLASPEIKQSYERQLQEINTQLQKITSQRNEAEIEIRLLEKVLDQIRESEKQHLTTCYVCGSHVDPSIWKVRIDVISKELQEKNSLYSGIKKEADELLSKKSEIEKKLKELDQISSEISKLKMSRSELENRIESVKSTIDDLERQRREMEERFNRNAELYRVYDINDSINKRIEELKKKKDEYEYELAINGVPSTILNKISEKQKELQEVQKIVDDLEKEYMRRLTIAREEFVKIANYLLKELEFDLRAEIDENDRLVVKRNDATLELRKLSSSERTTLALILVLTALKSYFKTPFFIVDESFMTFDQRRFDKIVKYLNSITDYVIITKSDENIELLKETMEPLASS
ncbi:BPS2 like protein (bps2) [Acidianus hospitalis W1]|uniref:BPS2 like protein (Bps2) n=1 Tax=Acidianus hospitalis (strain W1) TaxID=933801 RepID=F4B9V6_ACIHW|nr:archaea-specific SMC-related protein [Acidianus hospitalis]AEE95172.1 BPS2 like protein (bps2) [Acidianus hospitalis W1]